ncbi:hypothetical protein D3C79_697600 [compost metagenome]
MFHADFGGVLHLLHGAAHHFAQGACCHRAGHADLALATHLGTGNRRVLLIEDADGRRSEQKAHHTVLVGARHEAHVVVQNGRDDTGRAVGWRGDHAPTVGVLFVHCEGVEVDPVEHRQRIAQARFRVTAELAVQRRCPTLDLEPTRQNAFMLAAGFDTVLHHLPDAQQPGTGLGLGAPGRFVGEHHLADRQLLRNAMAEQFPGGFERVGQHRVVFDDAVMACGIFIDHEAAAHRVVLAAADLQSGLVEGAKDHAVGVVGQRLADHRQVLFFDEVDFVLAEQAQAAAVADALQAGGDGFGVDGVRVLAFQAQQHGLVTAVALAGGAQRAVQLGLDAGGGGEQAVAAQPFGEARGGAHRAHGVRAGGADADLEQVEDAQ